MEIIGDLHIHSMYSRATSKNLNFQNLVKYSKIKGLGLLGTGDFSHPKWMEEIKKLKEEGKGIYSFQDFPFILTNEISLVFTQNGKGRRIHLIVLAPSLEIAEQITSYLKTKGRIDYDGRPIFNISCEEFVEKMKEIDEYIEIIPAHIWTPWFGLFGSMSGFDSIKECFGDKADKIHSIETGMSSDPEMNWRISELNNRSILSFSDSHSFWPFRIGREATIFDVEELSYKEIIKDIRDIGIKGTIETEPAYGKYHFDGHRLCNFSCSPEEALKLGNICPKCNKMLTIGVEHRVIQLADQNIEENKNKKPYYKILPLQDLIAGVYSTTPNSKKCWQIYNKLIEMGSEFDILLKIEKEKLARVVDDKLLRFILKNREGKIKVKPGYDGVYGVALFEEQNTLNL